MTKEKEWWSNNSADDDEDQDQVYVVPTIVQHILQQRMAEVYS